MTNSKPSDLFLAFERTATRHGTRTAVWQEARTTSYDALLAHARHIAGTLSTHPGAGPFVAVLLDPGPGHVAAVLGVSSLDLGFLPLEADASQARMARMLTQARPAVIVTSRRHLDTCGALVRLAAGALDHTAVLLIDKQDEGIRAAWQGPLALPAAAPAAPTGGLYLLFTSGSTGEPKGIVGSTSGLLHFTEWEAREFGLDEHVAVPLLAPLSFDVSLRDIFTPLLVGGAVCIAAPGTRRDPLRLLDMFEQAQCTLMHCVPSLMRLLLDMVQQGPGRASKLRTLRHVLLAGEPLYGKDVNLWRRLVGEQAELVNLYGPSETTLAKVFHRIPRAEQDDGAIMPLGRPLPFTTLRVTRDQGDTRTPREVGEIVIETPYVSLGYFGLPQENRQRFLAHPSAGIFVGFRTGDLGHWDDRGLLCFNGRRDTQIKIRGNRAELSEIESCLMRHPRIDQAIVVAMPVAQHDLTLVCCYRAKGPIDAGELERHVEVELPDYMRPARFVHVQNFTLNANGKVDRAAVLRSVSEPAAQAVAEAALDGVQAEVVEVFRSSLGRRSIGLDDHFFSCGGSSLSGIAATSRLSSSRSVALGLADLLKAPTARQLCDVIVQRLAQPEASRGLPAGSGSRIPATPFQKMFWDFCQYKESKLAYNEPVVFEIDGHLNVEACRHVLATLVDRHEGLRTGFRMFDGQLVQEVVPSLPADAAFAVVDLRRAGQTREEAERAMHEADARPFDLSRPPLFRCTLYLLAEDHALLHALFAHVIVDDHSLNLLMREAHALYRCFATDAPSRLADPFAGCRLPATPPSGSWQAYAEGWRAAFETVDRRLTLPLSGKRPLIKSYAGDTLVFELPGGRALHDLAAQHRSSMFACLLVAVAELLGREAGMPELVLGVPMAARGFLGADRTFGNFLNTLPLRIDARPEVALAERLQAAHEQLMDAQCHVDVPLTALIQRLAPPTDFSRSALFDVSVTLTENRMAWNGLGIKVRRQPWHNGRSKLDLAFLFNDDNGKLGGVLEFNTRLFTKAQMQLLIERLLTILHGHTAPCAGEARP